MTAHFNRLVESTWRLISPIIVLLAACTVASASRAAPNSTLTELPEWKIVDRAIVDYFRQQAAYQPGDLLTRSVAAPLFERLAKLGWAVEDKESLLSRLPADDEFLVRSLSTPAGQRFMRKVAKYPQAFDRLERLTKLERGKRQLKDLINTVDGDQVIEFFTTTENGRELGKRLSAAPGGSKFNQRTGRIYNAAQLTAELKSSYEREAQAAARR